MTRRLHAVPSEPTPPPREVPLTLSQFTDLTSKVVRQRGADSLELTIVDAHGQEWNGTLPAQLRCRAIAAFPDGHTVEGDSDFYDGGLMIYIRDNSRWMQACQRLTLQFGVEL